MSATSWEKKKPQFGDQIRVNRGLYYHHGIYVDDEHVIQFGATTRELDPSQAKVIDTSLVEFLKDAPDFDVRVFTEEELSRKRNPVEVVNYAFSQLGRGGYDVLKNNCEHFANECLFGEASSEQVDKVKEAFSSFFRKTFQE